MIKNKVPVKTIRPTRMPAATNIEAFFKASFTAVIVSISLFSSIFLVSNGYIPSTIVEIIYIKANVIKKYAKNDGRMGVNSSMDPILSGRSTKYFADNSISEELFNFLVLVTLFYFLIFKQLGMM